MRKLGLPAIKNEEHWTYAHYKTWPDDERWELIHGVAYNMSATPATPHQALLVYFIRKIGNMLEGRPCQLFAAPFDVFLPAGDEKEDDIDTIVQPDVVVICDKNKINYKGCRGAPDLIIEILSPSTSRKDQREKFDLYQEKGVREYWVVDVKGRWITQYLRGAEGLFDNGTVLVVEPETGYGAAKPGPFLESVVLEGFALDLKECFAEVAAFV